MSEKTKEELEKEVILGYLINYLNIEKKYPLLPGVRNTKNVAGFLGLTPKELADARTSLDEQAEQAAEELLKDEEFQTYTTRLPFKEGDLIVAVGDSSTDDLMGWFEIMRHVLEISRPELELRFKNAAVYQDTSFDILRRLNRAVVDENADWLFASVGTYDAMRLGALPDRNFVSITEYWENLNSIEKLMEDISDNPMVWITPVPVQTEEMQKFALFEGTVHNTDLNQYREVIAGRKGFIVDPKGVRFGNPPEHWNYINDGVNASIAGHMETVKETLKTLYSRKAVKSRNLDYGVEDDFLDEFGIDND